MIRRCFSSSILLVLTSLIMLSASVMQFHHHHSPCRHDCSETCVGFFCHEHDSHHNNDHERSDKSGCGLHLSDFESRQGQQHDQYSDIAAATDFLAAILPWSASSPESEAESYPRFTSLCRAVALDCAILLLRAPPVAL